MPHNRGSPDRFDHSDTTPSGGGGGSGGGLTDAELRASPVDVTVTNFPAVQVVSATDLDIRDLTFATDSVDVSGSSVTVSNFPASVEISNDAGNPIPVSATDLDIRDLVFATDAVDVSGSAVSVTNFPATQPVSGTVEITNDVGNPIPVSGTVTVNEPVSVDDNSGSLTIDAGITLEVTGTAASAGVFSNFPVDVSMYRWVSVQLTGTWSGTVTFQGSNDGTNWSSAALQPIGNISSAAQTTAASNTFVHGPLAYKFFRLNMTSFSSGTATAVCEFSQSALVPMTMGIGTVSPGTTAGALGKAEDAAHASGDTGVAVWGVRNDSSIVTTSADGDYVAFSTDSSGRIRTASEKTEDGIHASGQVGQFILGVRNDAASTLTSTDGDYSPIATDSSGRVGITDLGTTISIDDGSGSITVDGPLTDAELRATPVPVSGTVSVTEPVSVDDNGGSLTVDASDLDIRDLSFATDTVDVSGSTVTIQEPLSVDDNGGSLTVDNLILTDVHDVGNNALQVSVVASTGGGLTDAELRATPVPVSATDLDIRDLVFATDKVDVSGSAVTNVVLSDAHDDPNNAIRVNVVAGSSGGPSKVDDAAFTVATDSVAPMGALADDTSPDSVDEGDVGIPRMSLNRNLYSQIRDGQGNERSAYVTASNALKVDGSAVTQPISGTVTIQDGGNVISVDDAGGSLTVDVGTALPAGTNNIGDVDVLSIPAFGEPQGVHSHNTTPTVYKGNLVLGINYSDLTVNAIDVDSVGRQTVLVEGLPSLAPGASTIGAVNLNAGTNNIGDVDVLTLPSIPAGTSYIGRTDGFNGVIKDNSGDDCTVKVAHLDMTTATTTDIVAAVASKKIRVLAYSVIIRESVVTNINFAQGTGTTRVTGSPIFSRFESASGTYWHASAPPRAFLFETGSGEALRVTQTGATDISVAVTYIEVD